MSKPGQRHLMGDSVSSDLLSLGLEGIEGVEMGIYIFWSPLHFVQSTKFSVFEVNCHVWRCRQKAEEKAKCISIEDTDPQKICGLQKHKRL